MSKYASLEYAREAKYNFPKMFLKSYVSALNQFTNRGLSCVHHQCPNYQAMDCLRTAGTLSSLFSLVCFAHNLKKKKKKKDRKNKK